MSDYRPGKKIVCLDELFSYESIYVTNWKKAHPTAFFLSWQYRLLKDWLDKGIFYTAIKKGGQ
jgi:hypothetical protein